MISLGAPTILVAADRHVGVIARQRWPEFEKSRIALRQEDLCGYGRGAKFVVLNPEHLQPSMWSFLQQFGRQIELRTL